MSFDNWTIEDLFTRCMDCDDMTLEMDKEEFAALRRKIAELQNRAPLQSGNSGQVPAGYVLVSAEFIDTVNQALKEGGDRKSFPGHSHDIPGVWDSDNGEKANKTCAQCAMWSKLHDMLAAAHAVSDGWIPVSERMPENNSYVSVVSRHGEYVSGLVNGEWLDLHDGSSFPVSEIYLWLTLPCLPSKPLPDAPKVTP